MAVITNTVANAMPLTAVTHPGNVKGVELNVDGKLSATLHMFAARTEATANTNAGTFYVQTNAKKTGDDDWATRFQFTMNNGTVPAGVALTATEPAAETSIAMASTTGFVAGALAYLKDSTLANSEFRYLKSVVASTSLELFDGITEQKDTSDTAWAEAEVFSVTLSLTSEVRLRVLFVHEGTTGADCDVKAEVVYGDSIG